MTDPQSLVEPGGKRQTSVLGVITDYMTLT